MKVTIRVQGESCAEACSTLNLVANPSDTVVSLKERIAIVQNIPFPQQDLAVGGKVLEGSKALADCGVEEGSALDLVIRASPATLAQQLTDLLKARDLSCDELGLLYCYKYGCSFGQALAFLGCEGKLQDFLKSQKQFQLENNHVTLVREDTALKPFSVTAEVEAILKATPSGSMDTKELCSRFVQKFNVPLASVAGCKPSEFFAKEKDLFQVSGRGRVSLRGAVPKSPPWEKNAAYPGPGATPPAAAPVAPWAAKDEEAPPGLGGWESAQAEALAAPGAAESQQYVELHNKICGRAFNSKITQALSDAVEALSEASFLDIDHVTKGGSVGKGTAISGLADAEAVFFLKGLPPTGQERWLPPLLRAAAGVLSETLGEGRGFDCIQAAEDSVHMRVKGLLSLNIRFSPVFGNYGKTIQVLGEQGPDARRFYATSLVDERTQFIARQPGQVKVTIRLLKWWRDQQEWSGKLVRPTDEVLELLAVYSAVQTKPTDQRMAIANVMSLMSRFDELRIVWSNYYSKNDVWAPLLRQRPLLMDPVNPFINIADAQSFDARELMALARTTHFFW
jgi:hypothetical protein